MFIIATAIAPATDDFPFDHHRAGFVVEASTLKSRLFSASRSARQRFLRACLRGFCAVLPALLMVGPASAGHITLQIDTTSTVRDDQLQSRVTLTNQGDESAANIQVHVELQGKRDSSPIQASLGVQRSYARAFSRPIAGLSEGRHPLVVIIDYTDTNGYPLTALSFAEFIVGADNPPRIHGVIKGIELGREAELELRVKNLDSTPRALKLRLILPKEISSSQAEYQIALGASSEHTVSLPVRNFSALEGSRYQILVLVEYDEQSKHSSLVVPGIVKIVGATDLFRTYRVPLAIGVGILILLFVGLQFHFRFRKPSGH
ncbi:MAG: hypothetical protein A3H91_01645 [Gammaproteobacteria bacterium RIFCSPLOWO2_02_FULL_61_13]|nr:MAG: hypothetical protein A3H91_01645 [Gammaproteobacteria bacterium RIFCSPLOWO2_02_FULL_61_13]